MNKIEELNKIVEEIKICKKCKLCEDRLKTVPGEGSSNAEIMICSEGPGMAESEQGRPFVGRSGKLLSIILNKELNIDRKDIFITNIVKCRPPNNRDPEPDEVEACFPYLKRQIKIIQPKVIITLGRIALQSLFNDKTLKITKERGIWREYEGISLMPTYHPAYLLRNMTEKNKNDVKYDLKQVKEKLKEFS